MKKLLNVLLVLAFVFGATLSVTAEEQADKTAELKAQELCAKKGLTGTQLDECIKSEVKKAAEEKAAPSN